MDAADPDTGGAVGPGRRALHAIEESPRRPGGCVLDHAPDAAKSALGSWSGGLIHDWTNSYDLVIVFALINLFLGMAPFLVVPTLRR